VVSFWVQRHDVVAAIQVAVLVWFSRVSQDSMVAPGVVKAARVAVWVNW
jgi:hypothetical protein